MFQVHRLRVQVRVRVQTLKVKKIRVQWKSFLRKVLNNHTSIHAPSTSKYCQSGNEVSLQFLVMSHTVASHTAVALQKKISSETRECDTFAYNHVAML